MKTLTEDQCNNNLCVKHCETAPKHCLYLAMTIPGVTSLFDDCSKRLEYEKLLCFSVPKQEKE